jgi:hypothetical protein
MPSSTAATESAAWPPAAQCSSAAPSGVVRCAAYPVAAAPSQSASHTARVPPEMAPPSSRSASSTPHTTPSPLGTRPGPNPASSSAASTAPARSPAAHAAARSDTAACPASPACHADIWQCRASAPAPWSSRTRDSGPNTGDGSHQRTTLTSRSPAVTRSWPADASSPVPGDEAYRAATAFGSRIASGWDTASTRGAGALSGNSR